MSKLEWKRRELENFRVAMKKKGKLTPAQNTRCTQYLCELEEELRELEEQQCALNNEMSCYRLVEGFDA